MMMGISLHQPHASLVAIGAKPLETRSWVTKYRGPLAIHAAQAFTRKQEQLRNTPDFLAALSRGNVKTFNDLPRGCLIAVCDLVDCGWVRNRKIVSGEWTASRTLPEMPLLAFGDFSEGRCVWFLENIRQLTATISFTGHQRLFPVPDALLAGKVRAA